MGKFRVHVEYYTMVEADSAGEAECMVEDSDLPTDAEVLDVGAEPVRESDLRCPLCNNDVQIGHDCPSDTP